MVHPFPFLLLFAPLFVLSVHRDSHIFNLIHRNREDEANFTRFSLFSVQNSEGLFSFASLAAHAFPCPVHSLGEWRDSSAILLFPCHHGTVVDTQTFDSFVESNGNFSIPSKCSLIRGFEMDFTAVQIPLNITLRLDGSQSLRVFSDFYPRHSKHLDQPIIHFSYIRNDEDCELACDHADYSVYSTPSCIGVMTSEDEIDMCDMTEDYCKWESFPPGEAEIRSAKAQPNQRYIYINATKETVIFYSPYIAHTSIKCSFTVGVFLLNRNSSVDLSYSTLDGLHSHLIHLPQSHAQSKLMPLTISIGHFFSPVKIEITCHKGSICHLDNLRMNNCEDDSPAVEVCPPSSSFLCSSSSHSKCLSHDRVCDLVPDCSTGEDEENCEDIPTYGRCDFSTSSIESFCTNWTTTGFLNGTSFGKAKGRDGYSMQIVVEPSIIHRTMSFTSPKLPRTSKKLTDPQSPLFQSCTLRFSYCASTREPWTHYNWMIGIVPLWSLNSSTSSKCEWKREVIAIPSMIEDYSLAFDIILPGDSTPPSFEMADISIAESCFVNDTSSISLPAVYNLWPCNATGPSPPSIDQCQRFYNETDETEQLVIEKIGWLTWIAPETNQYRVELCGASGGSIEGKEGGRAGCVVAILPLSYTERLEVMIGQEGETTSAHCEECESTPGGGATVIKRRDAYLFRPILIAGGGGGVSKKRFNPDRVDGGLHSSNVSLQELQWQYNNWQRGDGFSHAFFPIFNFECNHCEAMSIDSNKGGSCPNPLSTRIKGGYGGGGPACGESPGPGGGYLGGKRNHRNTGGTSYVHDDEGLFKVFEGVHKGQGFVRIFPCSLHCPSNQSCAFISANRGESEMECQCIKGTDCVANSRNDSPLYLFIIAALLSVLAIAFLIYGGRQRRNRSRDKVVFEQKIQEIEMINRDMIDTQNSKCIDHLERIKLPHIARNHIFIKKLLGTGAFGEVYLAEIQEEEEETYQVAVKTLSLNLDKETQDDFTIETLLLHKMNHPHIVRALAINDECDPFYLILEYMECGDLRAFLRLYRQGNRLNEDMNMRDFLVMAENVASACEYLEMSHHVHRDIAARNCLVTAKGKERVVKLADFGMARDVYSSNYYRKQGQSKMPVKWLPPESFADGIFTSKSDVWSYGVLLWELFSLGHDPYPGLSNFEVMDTVRMGKRLLPPNGTPSPVYSLMLSTWRLDPSERPTFKHLLISIHTLATDEFESIKRPPPGKVPFGLNQTDDTGGRIEHNYPSITLPQKREEETEEGHEKQSLLD